MKNSEKTMEKIVALCKGRGFIFSGSEIYGGLANTWDYGPLGVELKNNVKKAWWKKFVQENPYNVGLDAAILMNPQVWVGQVVAGKFLRRPNRFVAFCAVEGQEVKCHVPNTGRCRELLIPGRRVYLAVSDNPNRATRYSLVAVDKEGLLVNMDSGAPNRAVEETILSLALPGMAPLAGYRREARFRQSRFDFFLWDEAGREAYLEVKGVTPVSYTHLDVYKRQALVTVNTNYKKYELEYLMKQSDSMTLIMIDGYKDCDYVAYIQEL